MSQPIDSSALAVKARNKRRVRNYLLDARFQLKYAGFLVIVAIVLSAGLGARLWLTSAELIAQSRKTVDQSAQTVRRGQQMLAESKKVSAVVAMNIAKDPVYADNPELAALFQENAAERDRQLDAEQRRLEQDAATLSAQSAFLAAQQRKTLAVLFGGLAILVVAIALAGIIFTHKVAGPIHKMKGLLHRVAEGHLQVHSSLRRGDELQHFFDTFVGMVDALRARQSGQVERIDGIIRGLDGKLAPDELRPLHELRQEMQGMLDH